MQDTTEQTETVPMPPHLHRRTPLRKPMPPPGRVLLLPPHHPPPRRPTHRAHGADRRRVSPHPRTHPHPQGHCNQSLHHPHSQARAVVISTGAQRWTVVISTEAKRSGEIRFSTSSLTQPHSAFAVACSESVSSVQIRVKPSSKLTTQSSLLS